MKHKALIKSLLFSLGKWVALTFGIWLICQFPNQTGDKTFFTSCLAYFIVLVFDYGRMLSTNHSFVFWTGFIGVLQSFFYIVICFLGLADIITMSVETVKETNSSAYHIINGQGYSFLTGPISIETFYNLTIFINIIVTCLEFAHPFTTVKSKKTTVLNTNPSIES